MNAESLQADTDSGSGVGCLGADLLDGDRSAYGVSPNRVFKADGLRASYDFIAIDALGKTDVSAFFYGRDTVLCENAVDFFASSFITLK